MAMKLLVRINLVLVPGLAAAALAAAYVCSSRIEADARGVALREAGLMMDAALTARSYTTQQVVPLLQEGMKHAFLPQSVPSYAATEHFLGLRAQHPEYSYKEATLNPTNPRDRATDWESDIIQQFRNEPQTAEITGGRQTPMGTALYRARPIRAEPACLQCHGMPSAAPATLITRYGADNGFGWQPREIVGAQIVSVPVSDATAGAQSLFRDVMAVVGGMLLALLLAVNAVVYWMVVRPLGRIAAAADDVSLGNTATAIAVTGSAEIRTVARAFERLRTSMDKALRLLEH